LYEPSIKTNIPQKASYSFHLSRWRELFNYFYLGLINFNTSFEILMLDHYTFGYHEVRFFPFKHKFFSMHLSRTLSKLLRHDVKESSNTEKSSINTSAFFYHVRKDGLHTLLEFGWCIAKSRGYSSIGKDSK